MPHQQGFAGKEPGSEGGPDRLIFEPGFWKTLISPTNHQFRGEIDEFARTWS